MTARIVPGRKKRGEELLEDYLDGAADEFESAPAAIRSLPKKWSSRSSSQVRSKASAAAIGL